MAKLQSISDCPPLPEVESVEFRHIPSWLGYVAGSDGSIWSCIHRYNKKGQPRYWRQLSQSTNKYGYRIVHVASMMEGKGFHRTVHSLICEAFHGLRPDGLDVCHNDGTRDNNVPGNLRYDTVRGNMADSIRLGTYNWDRNYLRGERHQYAKLTNEQVEEIRTKHSHTPLSKIAILYDISISHASGIRTGHQRKYG